MTDSRLTRLVEVARAYYLENRTQAEIARSLGISRSQVSRYLSEARELGIVQIRIVVPGEEAPELGDKLKQRYPHLRDVIVAPIFDSDLEAVRAIIGRYAANYLAEVVKPNQRLVLGCGRTLRAMVNALHKREVPGISVVQAMGNLGHEAHKIDYNEIAREAAECLGGRVYYLSAPAILGKGSGRAADLVTTNPILEHSLSLARQADIFVVGLGSLESDQLYARVGLIGQDELDDLAGRAVGDICGRFFDLNGEKQISAFEDRIVGIDLDDLRQAHLTIGVAGGPDKVAPLLGAIRGQLINVVVSDEQTVRSILALDDAYPLPGGEAIWE
ncbi:MAG TPA: sugar-binding transcriptional regulator [Chloroflexi bacterium]|nr:sugar-binding transcriptional regulator [Chloroflexota bacterium]